MSDIILRRYAYAPTATLGSWELPDDRTLYTVEPPWIYNAVHGSEPFTSCVPDGVYDLVPHDSERFGQTWALVNPDLKVYHYKQSDGIGRYGCLIHAGNTAADVVGCIAPGMVAAGMAVHRSADAMSVIRSVLGSMTTGHRLIIIPHTGTPEV